MNIETMSEVDAAWLHMDRPTNLMVVNTIVWTARAVDKGALVEVLQERLVNRFRRFGQRVEDPAVTAGLIAGPRWVDDPDFKVSAHLHTTKLPAPGDLAFVQQVAGRLASRPLPASRPMWELHLLTGFGAGCALLLRTHHAIADGAALVQVLLSITDPIGADAHSDRLEVREDTPPRRLPGPVADSASRLASTGAIAREWGARFLTALTDPASSRNLVGLVGRDAAMMRKLGFGLNPPRNILQGPLVPEKRVGWTRPVALAEVRQAGRDSDRTVNDVVLAAITAAFRAYLSDHGDHPDEVVVIVPVNLRAPHSPIPSGLGNRFGLVFLSLPTGEPDRERQGAIVKERMDRIKASREGVLVYTLLQLMGQLPRGAENRWIDAFAGKATAIVTNMVGPRDQVKLAGEPVAGAMAWVPVTGPVGLGLSIFSYAGQLSVGVVSDARLLPDLDQFLELLNDELAQLLRGA